MSELVKIEEENMNLVQQSEILADKYNEVEKKMIDSERKKSELELMHC